MSTNSGRDKICERCDHPMNEHTRKSESKCKNKACRKQWEICQSAVHGEDGGISHRICFKPCSCKEKYHPDKAKYALPLAPHEYKIGHPGYRARSEEEEEEDDEEEVLSPSPQAKHKASASSSKHGTTSESKHKTPFKQTSSKQTSKKPLSKSKSSSSSKQPISPSSESSEDPLSCSERTMGEMPGIADGMAQMTIAQTTTKYTYTPGSTTAYTNTPAPTAASYGTLLSASQSITPAPTGPSATVPDGSPYVHDDDIYVFERQGQMYYRFTSIGKKLETMTTEWMQETVNHTGRVECCWAYTGKNSGTKFWRWSMESIGTKEEGKGKGKGKGR